MKHLKLTFAIAILAMLFGFNNTKADEFEFFAEYDYNQSTLYALWFYDDMDDVEEFKIFLAEGMIENIDEERDQFEEIASFGPEEVMDEGGIFYYLIPRDLEDGDYTIFMSIYEDDGDVYDSYPHWMYVQKGDWNSPEIRFTTFPEEYEAFVGVEYQFDVDAEYIDDPEKEIVYSLVEDEHFPLEEGMQIDSETGLFTFTPTEKEWYVVGIRAELAEDENISAEFFFEFYVRGCENPSTITGEIVDQEGNLVDGGYVKLIDAEENDYFDYPDPLYYEGYYSQVVNGQYEFQADAGEFYLLYVDDLNVEHWYEDSDDWEDAESISIECGNEYTFDMNVEITQFETYTVSGQVITDDDESRMESFVVFLGYDGGDLDLPRVQREAYVKEDGTYSVELPDLYNYVAMAFSWGNRQFMGDYPLYYNQTFNPEEAEIIELDGDLTGIDFDFTQIPGIEFYEVSGRVTDQDGNPLEDVTVSFQGYNTLDWFMYEYWDQTYTDENGEYSLELPENFEFTAMAYNYDEAGYYMPLFYNQTYNRNEAETILLTENRDDIDFEFFSFDDIYNGSISGSVSDQNGNPLSDVFLEAYLVESDDDLDFLYHSRYSIAEENSNYDIDKLIPGKYIIFAFQQGNDAMPGFYKEGEIATLEWDEATLVEVFEDSETTDINVILQVEEDGLIEDGRNSGRANGQVVAYNATANGEYTVPGALVSVHSAEGKVIKANQSGAEGKFMLSSLPEGSYTLKVDKVGYEEVFKNFSVDSENMTNLGKLSLTPMPTSVEEVVAGEDLIEAYPNPAVDNATVSFQANSNVSTLTISNANGVELFRTELNTNFGFNEYSLNLNSYNSGVYYVNIQTGDRNIVTPIVIIK